VSWILSPDEIYFEKDDLKIRRAANFSGDFSALDWIFSPQMV